MAYYRVSDIAFTAPVGPLRYDLDDRPIQIIRAGDINQPDGDDVSVIVASGKGDQEDRTLDGRPSASWAWPVLDADATPNGNAAFVFTGVNQIQMSTSPVVEQPMSIVIALRVDDFTLATTSRIFSGDAASFCGLRTAGAGVLRMFTGFGTTTTNYDFESGLDEGEWGVFGFVFNATASKVLLPSGEILTPSLSARGCAGLRFGGNGNSSPGTGAFKGAIAEFVRYDRLLDDAALRAMQADIATRYGI